MNGLGTIKVTYNCGSPDVEFSENFAEMETEAQIIFLTEVIQQLQFKVTDITQEALASSASQDTD
jgi:hypothetical protein